MTQLSIVIAAYNEERRLLGTLERLFASLDGTGLAYEVLIVDDGSRDRTLELVKGRAATKPQLRWLARTPNQGRGLAIREGVLAASGEVILETDADGSVADEAIRRFLDYINAHPEVDCVFGSRQLPESRILAYQPLLRLLLGYAFHYLAQAVLARHITDFTLGFKMFRRRAAEDIFKHQFDNHYVAEAEIVYVARKRGWKIAELPVTWTDNRDSRVRAGRDSFRSFRGLAETLWRGFHGAYD